MELQDIQRNARDKFYEKDREVGGPFLVSVLSEEVGELARAVRRKDVENVKEEAADVVFMALCIANQFEVDVEGMIREKYVKRPVEEISKGWKDVPWKDQ